MGVEKNMPLKTVQKLMGHSSLIALDYYINLRTDDIKRDLLNTMPKKEIE
jgi:integrase